MEERKSNKRMVKMLITVDDTFTDCVIEPVVSDEWTFLDNKFLKVKEKGHTYFVNVDYVMTIEFFGGK